MALFGNKTKKSAEGGSSSGGKKTSAPTHQAPRDLSHVIKHARITEKATMQQAASVYTFDVARNATKRDIILAVKQLYKVTPRTVHVATVPHKNVRSARTGKKGVKSGGKKAYVYLKSGETINL